MKLVEKKYILSFVVITSLFALWGFANDITNPMVAAFQTLMELPAAKASLIQFVFSHTSGLCVEFLVCDCDFRLYI